MKEFLFGWLIKGQYQISALDRIIAYIEILIGFFLLLYIPVVIDELKEKWKKRKKK